MNVSCKDYCCASTTYIRTSLYTKPRCHYSNYWAGAVSEPDPTVGMTLTYLVVYPEVEPFASYRLADSQVLAFGILGLEFALLPALKLQRT